MEKQVESNRNQQKGINKHNKLQPRLSFYLLRYTKQTTYLTWTLQEIIL